MITQRIIIRSVQFLFLPPLSCYKPINRYSFINNSRPRKNAIIQRNASKRACVSSVSRRVLKNSPDILISPRDCIPTSEPRGKRRRLAGAKGEPADIRFHPFPSFLLFFSSSSSFFFFFIYQPVFLSATEPGTNASNWLRRSRSDIYVSGDRQDTFVLAKLRAKLRQE